MEAEADSFVVKRTVPQPCTAQHGTAQPVRSALANACTGTRGLGNQHAPAGCCWTRQQDSGKRMLDARY
jgi:hypothetical protein